MQRKAFICCRLISYKSHSETEEKYKVYPGDTFMRGYQKLYKKVQEMARLLREEMANWQRWDLTDDWKTASRLRVRLPPRQTITTVCLHRHHHYPLFHEVGLKRKKVDRRCKRKIWQEIMVAQNETSPPDCIPVIQVWWWWYVLGFDCILACRLDHILAYLALIAYWSCKWWWWQGHGLGQMISTGHWPALATGLRHAAGRTQTRNDKRRSGREENELQTWSSVLVHISDIIE